MFRVFLEDGDLELRCIQFGEVDLDPVERGLWFEVTYRIEHLRRAVGTIGDVNYLNRELTKR